MANIDLSILSAVAAGLTAHAAQPQECADIWSQLIRHQLEIVLRFSTEDRELMILRERPSSSPPLEGRNRTILERFLSGDGRKVISMELALSPSTVAQVLKTALAGMGLDCAPARTPSQLVLLVHGAQGRLSEAPLTVVQFEHQGRRFWVLGESLERPLFQGLAPAQRAVLKQLINGRTYGDIAAHRRTSYRTVANQVASACHRLGVSGRSDLLQLLAASSARRTALAAAAAR